MCANRISEAGVRKLVETFYADVRRDSELGPVFEQAVKGEWARHLDRMTDFWTSVLLASGRYKGDPAAAHARVPGIEPEHFDRWLRLFRDATGRVFDERIAADLNRLADQIGQTLRARLFPGDAPGSAGPAVIAVRAVAPAA